MRHRTHVEQPLLVSLVLLVAVLVCGVCGEVVVSREECTPRALALTASARVAMRSVIWGDLPFISRESVHRQIIAD
jgi:uncharacterized membrane protein